jgi:hypothetical protein
MKLYILVVAVVSGVAGAQVDYSQFVNPLLGSEGGIPGYACQSCIPLLRSDTDCLCT